MRRDGPTRQSKNYRPVLTVLIGVFEAAATDFNELTDILHELL